MFPKSELPIRGSDPHFRVNLQSSVSLQGVHHHRHTIVHLLGDFEPCRTDNEGTLNCSFTSIRSEIYHAENPRESTFYLFQESWSPEHPLAFVLKYDTEGF